MNQTIPASQGQPLFEEAADRGSVTPLIIGLSTVVLLVAATIIAITTVHVQRARLQSLADQTSTAVAVSVENIELGAHRPTVRLTDAQVRSSSSAFLVDAGAYAEFDGLRIAGATGSADGTTAEVELTSYVHLPIVSFFLPEGVEISATGNARSELNQ